MQDEISCDDLYTKLSASNVIWESEITRHGRSPETSNDHCTAPTPTTSFIGYGEQYAYMPSS